MCPDKTQWCFLQNPNTRSKIDLATGYLNAKFTSSRTNFSLSLLYNYSKEIYFWPETAKNVAVFF